MAKSYDEYRLGEPYERPRRKGTKVFAIAAVLMALTVARAMAARGGGGAGGGKSSVCSVSPSPVASDGDLTVSGNAGHTGAWINVYIYYSDGNWGFMGGSAAGGGGYSLSGTAHETHSSFWGPFYAAPSGSARVEVYAGTTNRDYGVVNTCTFMVT